jgi:phospholipid/cholesterol/gamma-HCH transport system permease protein
MVDVIASIGQAGLNMTRSLQETLALAFGIIMKLLDRRMYNSAMRMVLVHQIYFTSLQILPLFIAVSVIFGSLLLGIVFQQLKSFGLTGYLGHILVGFVVTELSPFVTVLLIALRSGSAINTEIAVMKVSKELRTLEAFNIDVINYLFLPRIINGILSVVLLSGLFSIVVLLSGLLYSKIILGMGLDAYTSMLVDAVQLSDIIVLLLKCCTFGFFIILIPIRSGLSASNELTSVPIAVLNGMVKVFTAIVIIEVLSLIIRFI